MTTANGANRSAAYGQLVRDQDLHGIVLTSEAAVAHAGGVRLYTQRLMPERPVALCIRPDDHAALVCCVLEADQLIAEHPGLDIRTFAEFGEDPWAQVVDVLRAAGPVQVESTMPVTWARSLQSLLGRPLEVGDEVSMRARAQKDADERELFRQACRAAEQALAAGATAVVPGVAEIHVADKIERRLLELLPGRAREVTGMAISPQNNRAMHHTSSSTVFPDSGPVRLGVLSRVDGYWVLIMRMLSLGDDPGWEESYVRYLDVYEAMLPELKPGLRASYLYELCRQRVAAAGFQLTTMKIAHSTGVDFREWPCVAAHEDAELAVGMVMAYDYGLESEDHVVLHIEDRVEITNGGAVRLSDAWDLSDLRAGYSAALG